MNWRAIMKGQVYEQNPQNPQNSTKMDNIANFANIAKGIEPELIERVSDACAGLDMTPEQFIRVLNSKAKEQIISGELSASTLKNHAKQIDDAINDGVVNLIMEQIIR